MLPAHSLTALVICAGLASAQPADTPQPRELPVPPQSAEPARPVEPSTGAAGRFEARVLEVFAQGNTTRMIIQSNRPLVSGRDVYVGVDEIAVNVGTMLSKSGDLHYYAGSVVGKGRVRSGDIVLLETRRRYSVPERIARSLDQSGAFASKMYGEITAVQGDRAMIDKGTLQEVHERDIYEITDASGVYKGLVEIRGIGDLQSSGRLYNRWEDRHRRALEAEPGDRVRFLGQRMQFALGISGGMPIPQPRFFRSGKETSGGGGLLWNITLPSGWGLELLAGYYQR
ncbi:MAG: hypothetical protein HY553_04745 [Elusimicrobia bacterium]|nr:hypothetical protein [Elusimicrobiota bacterium]